MFSEAKRGDTVLVSVPGKRSSMYETASTFLIPMTVDSHTPKRFTVGEINYNKKDGHSCPSGNGHCQPYDESKDETSKLEAYNAVADAINGINNHLYQFGKLQVKRGIGNPHTILEQAKILAVLIEEGQDGKQ